MKVKVVKIPSPMVGEVEYAALERFILDVEA